jgi:hypothetical protein
VFDAATGGFVQQAAKPLASSGASPALYELVDKDGALFAYIDQKGRLWVIDDLIENPSRLADDEVDDWIMVAG